MAEVIFTGPTPGRPNPFAGVGLGDATTALAQGVFGTQPQDLGAIAVSKVTAALQQNPQIGVGEAILNAGLSQPETAALLEGEAINRLMELFDTEQFELSPGETAFKAPRPGAKPEAIATGKKREADTPKLRFVPAVGSKGEPGQAIFLEGDLEQKGFLIGVGPEIKLTTTKQVLEDSTEITRIYRADEFAKLGTKAEELSSFVTKRPDEDKPVLSFFTDDEQNRVVVAVDKNGKALGAPKVLGKVGGSSTEFERELAALETEGAFTAEQILAIRKSNVQPGGQIITVAPDGTITIADRGDPATLAAAADATTLSRLRAKVTVAAEADLRDATVSLSSLANLLAQGKRLPTGAFGARGGVALFLSGVIGQFAPESAKQIASAITGGATDEDLIPLMQNALIVAIQNIDIFTGEESSRISGAEQEIAARVSKLNTAVTSKAQFIAAAENILMFRLVSADRFRIETGQEAALDLDDRTNTDTFLSLMQDRYGLSLANAKDLVLFLRNQRAELAVRGKALF